VGITTLGIGLFSFCWAPKHDVAGFEGKKVVACRHFEFLPLDPPLGKAMITSRNYAESVEGDSVVALHHWRSSNVELKTS